jgi:hypothetical protein
VQKHRFIASLLAERDRFELLLNRMGFSRRMTMPGVCGAWSLKDLLATILANEQNIADRLHDLIQGEILPPAQSQAEFDAFLARFGYPDFSSSFQDAAVSNAWVIEKYRAIPLEEVVAQEVNAFNAIISALDVLSDEQFAGHNFAERVRAATSARYRKHRTEIEHWLASQENSPTAG